MVVFTALRNDENILACIGMRTVVLFHGKKFCKAVLLQKGQHCIAIRKMTYINSLSLLKNH